MRAFARRVMTTRPANRTAALPSTSPGARSAGRPVQVSVVALALTVLGGGVGALSVGYGMRHGALFLVGGGLGLVLYHAAFGFTTAFRAFAVKGDGRGLRAQILMLAVATILFAPMLASGQAFGGAVAPVSLSVLVGAALFAIGMQLGGG
jgi:uncharacterized membrane protein YedE/YeeE